MYLPFVFVAVFHSKRKCSFTQLETWKQIIEQSNKKTEYLTQYKSGNQDLALYALEENEQNMLFKKEAHEKALQDQDKLVLILNT